MFGVIFESIASTDSVFNILIAVVAVESGFPCPLCQKNSPGLLFVLRNSTRVNTGLDKGSGLYVRLAGLFYSDAMDQLNTVGSSCP